MRKQEGVIDRRTGHQAVAGVRRHCRWNGPVAATRGVASVARSTLCCRQARVGPADGLEPPHVDPVGNGCNSDESAETVIPGVTRDEGATLAPVRSLLVL